jgi:hypothetical protein
MSNPSTVAGFVGSGTTRNTFPTQIVNSASETILKINQDTGTANYFLVAPTGGSIYGAQTAFDVNSNASITRRSGREYGLPSGETNDQFSTASWDGHPFKVRIAGVGNAGHHATQTLLFNLYQGTSATLGSDFIIGTTGAAFAIAASTVDVAYNFYIEATLLWDATSQVLSGSYMANIAGGTTSQFTTSTVVTNVPTPPITAAGLSFLATVTFADAVATSSVIIREFVIDKL